MRGLKQLSNIGHSDLLDVQISEVQNQDADGAGRDQPEGNDEQNSPDGKDDVADGAGEASSELQEAAAAVSSELGTGSESNETKKQAIKTNQVVD